jgi:hypothetical protein
MGGLAYVLALLIAVGAFAGLFAASRRLHVEAANRRVEIALDWQEVWSLAQTDPQHRSFRQILGQFHAQGVTTIVIPEDTVSSLELTGAIGTQREMRSGSHVYTVVEVDDPINLTRIRHAAAAHGWTTPGHDALVDPAAPAGTLFTLLKEGSATPPEAAGQPTGPAAEGAPAAEHATAPAASDDNSPTLFIPIEYATLRNMGIGLPRSAVMAARSQGLRIAGRISNFPGVTPAGAEGVLRRLQSMGATTVIYAGDEVLGYRGLEKSTVPFLTAKSPSGAQSAELHYGAVEFGKQKGDEKLQTALQGEFVRVHAIQAAEMGQIDENEAIDRFVRAARERNIRFCFVRLLTLAGADPVEDNVKFVRKIVQGIDRGSAVCGGRIAFGPARPFRETGVTTPVFALLALGVAAGTVWMLRLFLPFSRPQGIAALLALSIACVGLAVWPGDVGRKLVALLAGISFPTAACLVTFPRPSLDRDEQPPRRCVAGALRALALASCVTAIGIVHVVGLLATRSFIAKSDQFMGIKAQHAVPILLIALCAVLGGAAYPGESWRLYRRRAIVRLQLFWQEPIRVGLLLLTLIALAALAIVVIRTGNDPGVGVSGFELKARSVLDRILPVRPRTKEFLVGHPLFVLGIAWWLRGRRRLAVPAFVAGSVGQVSLLNTFCHIHTPLIVSIWRDGIGLVIGAAIGIALFLIVERLMQPAGAGEAQDEPEAPEAPDSPDPASDPVPMPT